MDREVLVSQWQRIRLELARTGQFPEGSSDRGYVMRLPLDEFGAIDATAFRANPAIATVRRFWPGEIGLGGNIAETQRGWIISYRPGEEDDETIHHLETHRLKLGEYISLTEPDGTQLPFRVAAMAPMQPQPA